MTAATVKVVAYKEDLNCRTINVIIGDGSAAITTTVPVKAAVEIPCACTIKTARLYSIDNTSGAIAIAVWKDSYANHPPIAADLVDTFSIAASGVKSEETGLSISLAKGDVLFFNVDSVTSMKHILIALGVEI